jgi:Ca-activated chloride channel family protein
MLAFTRAAAAQEPAAPAVAVPSIAAPAPGTGALFIQTPDGLVPLPPLDMAVDILVTGPLVKGTVRQTFRNPTTRVIDATYMFPLPEGAALDSLEVRIGDRIIRSVVRERDEARAVYDTARREGRKAGLVEHARRGLFRTSVANLNPGEEVTVVLSYDDQADYSDGVFALSFPLTWTRRYAPGAPGADAPAPADPLIPDGSDDAGPGIFILASNPAVPRAEVRVSLEAGLPLAALVSPSHVARVTVDGARGTLETGSIPADRDFRLEWRLAPSARPEGAVFLEDRDATTYGVALLIPPTPSGEAAGGAATAGGARADAAGGLPTRTLFILDVSGSMEGPSIEQARLSLLRALDRLRPGDEFDILKFSTTSEAFRDGFLPAVPARLAEARAWVQGLRTESGTEILEALEHAERLMAGQDRRLVGRLILITDGAVDAGDEALAGVLRGLGDARLNAIGIGPAPNRGLMRALARAGRGACAFIGSPEEVGPKLDDFLARIDRPVLSDLALEWEGAPPRDVLPDRLPDLHAGEPLLVSFRLDPGHPGTRAVLRGWNAAGRFATTLEVTPDAPRGAGVAARWARARVESLLDGLRPGADPAPVRPEVVALGIEFNLVTPFTSLVAVEERPTAAGPSVPGVVPNVVPGSADGGMLPQTGTLDPLWLRAGLLLVVLGAVVLLVTRISGV